jgi:DNA-binding CsgD family transcriptional regulator
MGYSDDLSGLLTRILDALAQELVLVRTTGEVIHANRAMIQALKEAGHEHIRLCLGEVARSLSKAVDGRGNEPRETETRDLAFGGRVLRVRATYISNGSQSAVLIGFLKLSPEDPSVDALRTRYRLTPRESKVAHLLALRKSNAEIAGELEISPHTARHHTESVFAKLGVHSRVEAARLLTRASSEAA